RTRAALHACPSDRLRGGTRRSRGRGPPRGSELRGVGGRGLRSARRLRDGARAGGRTWLRRAAGLQTHTRGEGAAPAGGLLTPTPAARQNIQGTGEPSGVSASR